MRRRASSDAATILARDATRSARACALATAVPTRSVNSAMRAAATSGKGWSTRDKAVIAPQTDPPTMMGAPTAVYVEPGNSGGDSSVILAGLPVSRTGAATVLAIEMRLPVGRRSPARSHVAVTV